MSRFETRAIESIKVGDVIVSTGANCATRNLVTQVRHTMGSTRYVFDYFGMAGADYVALDAPNALTVDTNTHDVMTPDNFSATLYEGQLALYRQFLGGYIKVRILAINLEDKTAKLEVTATRDTGIFHRGYLLHDVPFSRIACREALRRSRQRPGTQYELFRPRFSARWIDYPTSKSVTK